MSGFMQEYKTRNKSTDIALLKLRDWRANFGFPMTLVSDSWPAFRYKFDNEWAKIGVHGEHSSVYNPSSQSGIERLVGSLKNL